MVQTGLQTLSETEEALQGHSNLQKDNFFLAGSPMGEPKHIPKSGHKDIQNQLEALLCGCCLPTSAIYWIWGLQNMLLARIFGHLPILFLMVATIPLNLWFSKDVSSILHVFDNRKHCFQASSALDFENFFTCLSSFRRQGQNVVQKSLQMRPQTTSLGLPEHKETTSETMKRKS